MEWNNFLDKLKALSPDIHFVEVTAVKNTQEDENGKRHYLVGLYYRDKHIASVTYDDGIPFYSVFRKKGHVVTHAGLKTILKELSKHFPIEKISKAFEIPDKRILYKILSEKAVGLNNG